jgi:hypothetical protein
VAVTEEDRARELERTPPEARSNLVFPKYQPIFRRFFLSDSGHIIVQTQEKTKDGMNLNDVFDPEGRFIGRISLKPSGTQILKSKYYALEEDKDGYQYVKRYSVTWKAR